MHQKLNINFIEKGRLDETDNPVVFCIHGIMGNSRDFDPFVESWGKDHLLIIPDLLPGSKMSGNYSATSDDGDDVLVYTLAPDAVVDYLETNHPGRKAYLVGISFGGKICFEVARKIPEKIVGVCATDVGLGHLCKSSDLFRLVFEVIPELNLDTPWKTLRQEIKHKIEDRMLRVLIHSHLEYPQGPDKSARWKSGTKNFYGLLKNSSLEDQWPVGDNFPVKTQILKATENSAIDDVDFERMKTLGNIDLHIVEGSNHFIHVHRSDVFKNRVESLLKDTLEKNR